MISKNSSFQYLITIAISILMWIFFLIIQQKAWVIDSSITDSINYISTDTSENTADSNNVVIPARKIPSVLHTPSKTKPKHQQTKDTIKINQADSIEWQKLYGIGPYRAGRILNFREALGGFVSIDQVNETYGLPDSVFQEIKNQLQLVRKEVTPIYINFISYDSLYKHPYVTKQMSYFIMKYRSQNKNINDFSELKEIILKKDHQRLQKVKPYLNFRIYKD